MTEENKQEKIMKVATSRGFFFPSAEIYGSKAGFWTYGHLGTLLKQNWSNLWRKTFLTLSDNYFEIEDCNILPKKVFEGSGHLENFNDPLTECKKCHFRFRADQLIEDATGEIVDGWSAEKMDKEIKDKELGCPKCKAEDLDEVKWFNMMFKMGVGATSEEIMYLRPETAQSPYLSFKREFMALREKLPMGLAVVGKAFRNEISPRQGFFRLREFTQAELQIFFDSDNITECENWDEIKDYKIKFFLVKNRKDKSFTEITCAEANKKLDIPKFYLYHAAKIQQFYLDTLEIPKEKFRFRELDEEERAFYNKIHFDIELDLDTLGGFKEVAGLHYRGDHDLGGHQKTSNTKLQVNVDGKKVLPHVLELSFGVDRNVWALIDIFYKEDKERTYFNFPMNVAPFQLAVLPLVKKEGLPEIAREIYDDLWKEYKTFFDVSGSVGRRYRRMDEIGGKYCITVDFDSKENKDVTLRDNESMKQVRLKIKDLKETLKKLEDKEISFEKAGKAIESK